MFDHGIIVPVYDGTGRQRFGISQFPRLPRLGFSKEKSTGRVPTVLNKNDCVLAIFTVTCFDKTKGFDKPDMRYRTRTFVGFNIQAAILVAKGIRRPVSYKGFKPDPLPVAPHVSPNSSIIFDLCLLLI